MYMYTCMFLSLSLSHTHTRSQVGRLQRDGSQHAASLTEEVDKMLLIFSNQVEQAEVSPQPLRVVCAHSDSWWCALRRRCTLQRRTLLLLLYSRTGPRRAFKP